MAHRGINKIILIGYAIDDPDSWFSETGQVVAKLTLATICEWTDEGGRKQKYKDLHRIVFYDKPGEIAELFIRKGTQIYLEGRLRTPHCKNDRMTGSFHKEVVVSASGVLFLAGRTGHMSENNREEQSSESVTIFPCALAALKRT